jgi:hypothetical protein
MEERNEIDEALRVLFTVYVDSAESLNHCSIWGSLKSILPSVGAGSR